MDVVPALKIINRCSTLCMFSLSLPQTSFLEVVIPPDIVNEETSGDLMVPEGGSAKFICKAGGYPKPKIVWRREDSREIIARETSKGRVKAMSVEGETLSLTKVTRSEMGSYLCIASNGVPPSVSKRMKLQINCESLEWSPVGATPSNFLSLHSPSDNPGAEPIGGGSHWQRRNSHLQRGSIATRHQLLAEGQR